MQHSDSWWAVEGGRKEPIKSWEVLWSFSSGGVVATTRGWGKSGIPYDREGHSKKAENGSSPVGLHFPNQHGRRCRTNTPVTVWIGTETRRTPALHQNKCIDYTEIMGPFQNENSTSVTINNKHPYILLMGVNFGENGNKYCTGFQE